MRTYWDIVIAGFRRNTPARISLWLVVILFLVAIFTPMMSNDRPYAFRGSMGSFYRFVYFQLRGGAWRELATTPQRYRSERRAWEDGKISLAQVYQQITRDDYDRIEPMFKALRARAVGDSGLTASWEAMEIPLDRIREEARRAQGETDTAVLETGLSGLELMQQRVPLSLLEHYVEKQEKTLAGIDLNFKRLGAQLGAEEKAVLAGLLARARAVATREFIEAEGEARASHARQVEELVAAFQAGFAPTGVDLQARWYFPVFDSLHGLDVFLMLGALGTLVVLGPWRWLRRRVSFRVLALVLLAAAVSGGAWWNFHAPRYDIVRFKSELEKGGVVMEQAVWPPHRYRYDEPPGRNFVESRLRPPSAEHPLGTDARAKDMLTQILWGSRVSLAVGFVSAAIAMLIGVFMGAIAGYFRGITDIVVSRVIEWMLCIPALFAVLAAVAVLPPNIFYVMLVIGLFGWMGIARLTRAEFFRLGNQDFVTAARALGASHSRIIVRHVLPNSLAPVLVAGAFAVASGILIESSLSFLGFGVRAPQVSWGSILSYSREKPEHFWLIFTPGFLIFITVTAYNLLGEGIRDAIDPRLKV